MWIGLASKLVVFVSDDAHASFEDKEAGLRIEGLCGAGCKCSGVADDINKFLAVSVAKDLSPPFDEEFATEEVC